MKRELIEEVTDARSRAYDSARPEDVAARHADGHLTARERIEALCDPGSFIEYGVQAQAGPGTLDTPADGLVAGAATMGGRPVAVSSYDHTVHRGTQSLINQNKIERLLFLAIEHRWPFICFADGEGGRPQLKKGGFGIWTGGGGRIGLFDGLCELSGWALTVAVVSGTALDGNAALAMFSDFVVATAGSVIGTDEATLAAEVHEKMGDIDLMADDEPSAIEAVRRYLSYFTHDLDSGEPSPDAADIQSIIPENRRRAYDMHKIIDALADVDSVLELRPNWGNSMITSLVRMDGRAVGIFGNQPYSRVAGAIDADAADKMSRFIELCDAYHIPLVSLIDSPGFYIGPEAERGGIARHHVRTLLAIEHRSVPLYCVQLRKAYGLGPLVMRGSWGHLPPELRLAWPTVETGGMSLEGAAFLVKRKEIMAAKTPDEAQAIRNEYAETLRKRESGISAGRNFSFDEVIDPAETRDRIINMLRLTPRPEKTSKKTYIDTI